VYLNPILKRGHSVPVFWCVGAGAGVFLFVSFLSEARC